MFNDQSSLLIQAISIILSFWWVYLFFVLLAIFKKEWMDYIQDEFIKDQTWTILEVQIPKEEGLGPKAAEQIFAGINGTGSKGTLVERYVKGKLPDYFSFEIVGINGEIHFFIRTLEKHRNLVESLIYAQYPTAMISEAEDYAKTIAKDVPNKNYNLFGTELILANDTHYPIRTYEFFEDKLAKRMVDPLSSFSEILTKLQDGEMVGIQILVRATDNKWKEESDKAVAKLTGKKVAPTPKTGMEDLTGRVKWEFKDWLNNLWRGITFREVDPQMYPEDKTPEGIGTSLIQHLSPGEKDQVKAIEEKSAKVGFESKIRIVYYAKSDIMNIGRFGAVMGAFKQFSAQNLNSFKPDSKVTTKVDYLFKNFRATFRKRKLIDSFIKRKLGSTKDILNIEELATLYHFPDIMVQAPMMPRVEAKKAQPPMELPI